MCGIIGSINAEWTENPLKLLQHRGPDSQNSIKINNVFLGHTRLSILDLSSRGGQPMESHCGRYILIYNGEIYNHIKLRKRLRKRGYSFTTKTDTETLLNSWIEWGYESVNLLEGIFSFAIYDKNKNYLTIVRDSFGVKPLYLYQKDNILAFSSEIKALVKLKSFNSTINFESIVNYLTFLWSPGSKTMYKYIKKILPGDILQINSKNLKSKYLPLKSKNIFQGDYWKLSEKEWIKKIDNSLNKAVEDQMLSDAPLGFFLSGGLDSSLLVAIAKSQSPTKNFECFTVDQYKNSNRDGFIDDLPFAKKVAKHLNVSLNIIDGRYDWTNSFDNMIWQLDEPQADLAPINLMLISRAAKKKGIKVLIGGTGGDDVFSGYRRHQALIFNNSFQKYIPNYLSNILSQTIHLIPSANTNIRRIKKMSRDWGTSEINQVLGYFNWLPSNNFVFDLFSQESLSKIGNYDPYSYGIQILSKKNNLSKLDQILVLEQSTFLIDHNLNYTDKLSMYEGVEARVPYLDTNLVRLAGHIPQNFKMRKRIPKYLLKKVAEKYLPKEVIYRPKTGFGAPVKELIKNKFNKMIKLELNQNKIDSDGIFNSDFIERMLEENKKGTTDYSYNILSLLAIQSWLKQYPWSLK